MKISAVCRAGSTLIWLIVAVSIGAQDTESRRSLAWEELSNPPGSYSESISLYPAGSRELEYRFLDQTGFPHTTYFLPLADGIELHAPRDTEIRYAVELRRVGEPETAIVGSFTLDTLAPRAPQFSPAPGLHTVPIVIQPETPRSNPSDAASVYLAVRTPDSEDSEFTRVVPEGVPLTGDPGAVRDYQVSAYSLDAAGNRSTVATYRYRIDRTREAPPVDPPIISPRPGSYANEQILLVDDSGLTDLSVVLSARDDDPVPLSYPDMPLITGSGEFTITLTATVISSGEPYQHRVAWRQEGKEVASTQGRATSTVRVRPPADRARYNLEDLPVARSDPQWLRSVELVPPPDGTRRVVIRYRADADEYDTRLAFVLDGRRAPLPQVATTSRSDTVSLYSLAQTELQWGPVSSTEFERYSNPVQGSATLNVNEIAAEEVVVRARFPGGPWTQRTVAIGAFRSQPFQLPRPIVDDGVTISAGSVGESGELTLVEESSGAETVRFRGEYPLRWRPPGGFSATLMSERDRTASVLVDRTPLAPPTVTFRDNRLVLSGDGQMFYRVDGAAEMVYQNSVELPGVAGARRRYRVDAYRILEGRISPTVTVYPIIDDRQPAVPPPRVSGAVARGPTEFVSREESPTISFSSPYDDLRLHYEASSTGEALLPQTESPLVGDGIVLSAPAGEETRWRIRVRGRFPGQGRWSPLYRMTVTVDRKPPAAPVLTSDPRVTGVVAFDSPPEDGTTVWYRLRESEPYQRYEGPVTIDRDRLERAVMISAYTRDQAGNRTELSEAPLVQPLNEEPAPPQLMINGRLTSDPRIVLSREGLLEVLDPTDVRWRIIDVARSSEPPGFESVREPRLLSSGTYRINAYREQGSERSRVIERIITIDLERPRKPAVPYLSYASDGRSGTVYWPGARSERIFASLVTNSENESSGEPFSVSEGTVQWQIPKDSSYVTLAYFSVGESGQRSETEVLRIEAARLRPPAELSGVRNGERYRSERTVQLTGSGDIRFTVTSDGSSPETVRVSSPRYAEPLLVSAAVGETTHYRIRYRTFDGDSPVSEEREVSFVIDREAPQLPGLMGAAPNGYYSERRVVRLVGDGEGDTIMYRVAADSSVPPDFSPYGDEPLLLEEDSGGPRRYRIDAYSVDTVGNRSPGIATWNITIDATSLHVSAAHGDDRTGDGSRQAPLATLDMALRRIAETSRDTIFLTSGTYPISAAALVTQPDSETVLNLIGGFDPVTWRSGSARSIIDSGGADLPPLRGTVRLERLSFSQTLHLGASGADDRLELRSVEVRSEGSPGIIQSGGSLSVHDSSVAPAVEVEEGATFDAQGSALGSLRMRGGVATVADSIASGLRLHDGSRIVVSNSRIAADRTVDISGLIYADASVVELNSSLIQSTSEDPILIRGRDADIRVHGSALYGTGERSAVAIRARGGRLTVFDSMIDVSSQGYAYGVFVRSAPVELVGSAVIMRSAGDGIAIATSDGALSLNNSILWVSTEEGAQPITGTAVSANGHAVDDLVIRNSALLSHRVHDESSTAIRLGSEGAARIRDSALGGWPFSLIQSTSAAVWERSGRLPSVDDLNRSQFASGNRRRDATIPPARRTPTVPQSSIPAELRELLDGYSQNHSGASEP